MAQTMVWETKRHEDEISTLHRRVQTLQGELSQSCQEKGHTDSKLLELDQLVSQLLAVNETLVSQLSGKPIKGLGLSSPLKKSKASSSSSSTKKIKKTVVPRAASAGTAASDASKTTKFVTRQHSQLIPVRSEDLEQLRSMHKMYATMARNISGTGGSTKKSKSGAASSDASVGSVKSSTSLSSGRKSGAGTRLSRKKAQLIERFSEDARMTQSQLNSSTGGHSFAHTNSSVDVRLPKPSISFDHSRVDDSLDFDAPHDAAANSEHKDQQDFQNYLLSRSSPSSLSTPVPSGLNNSRSNSILKSSTSYIGAGSQRRQESVSKAEIQGVISSLEDEFESLNLQYKRLLNNVQVPSMLSGETNNFGSGSAIGEQNIQAQAEEIVSVIQQLHRKGEQLRNLKSP
jgi:hypothetical protein